ncbi:hypothetical protein HDU96_009541 [Phlyctochytrium bullatum]|nr:hypothetical protein HDU96_009541 [Phlyctochytrium bullatum]
MFNPVVLPHVADVAAQVRYDDPRRVIRLYNRIPLERLARVDVGPNRQYIAIHFVDDGRPKENTVNLSTAGNTSATGNRGPTKMGRTSTERLSDLDDQQNAQASGPVHRPTIESIVLLTRDRNSTSKIIDSLVTTLYDAEEHDSKSEMNSKVIIPSAGGNKTVVLSRRRFKGPDGRVRLVNQDVEWSLRALRDLVLVRAGPKHVFWNSVHVDPTKDWKELWLDNGAGSEVESSGNKKKGWFGGLLDSFSVSSKSLITPSIANEVAVGSAEAPGEGQEAAPGLGRGGDRRRPSSSLYDPIITVDDDDPAADDSIILDKVNFEFLRLYQLVGWIVPQQVEDASVAADAAGRRTPGPSHTPTPDLTEGGDTSQSTTPTVEIHPPGLQLIVYLSGHLLCALAAWGVPQAGNDSSGNAQQSEGANEYWWDLVFSTLDGANEFLEYIRDVRGVKPDEDESVPPPPSGVPVSSGTGLSGRTGPGSDEVKVINDDFDDNEDIFGPSGASADDFDIDHGSVTGSVSSASRKDGMAGSFTALAAGSRDMRLKGRVRVDGVVFLIGDD